MVAGLGASGEKGKTFKKPLKQRRRGNRDHSRKKILLSDEGKMIEKEDEEGFGLLPPTNHAGGAGDLGKWEEEEEEKKNIWPPRRSPAPLSLSSVLYGGYTVISTDSGGGGGGEGETDKAAFRYAPFSTIFFSLFFAKSSLSFFPSFASILGKSSIA